jgi:hypothetical protein
MTLAAAAGVLFHPSGVNVMVTFFVDFRQFSAKRIAKYLKNNYWIFSSAKVT